MSKKTKYIEQKEVDLSKVKVPVITDEGKKELGRKAKLTLKVGGALVVLSGVLFIANEMKVQNEKAAKASCDSAVHSFLWDQKGMDAKMDAWRKSNEESGIRRTLWSAAPTMNATFREQQQARLAIAECQGVY